ncbi:MAG: PhoU domain-containing protein [Candidatus Hermodarchaeota archaeon]
METLDNRKLQKTTSGGTFLISLPGEWIRANSLKKGNELAIRWSKNNNYLLIFPKQENKKTRTEITINESDSERTQRDIIKYYLEGYEILIIREPKNTALRYPDVIKALSRRLFGLEVMGEERSKIELHYTADPHLDPRSFLEMSYFNAIKMFDDAIHAYLNYDVNLSSNVIDRDADVNRLYFVIVRMLKLMVQDITGQHNVPPVECLDFRMVASYAEHLGDKAVEIAKRVPKNKEPLLSSSKELKNKISDFTTMICAEVRQVVKAFTNHQVAIADKMKKKAQTDLIEKLASFQREFNDNLETDKLTFLLPFFQRLLEIIIDIADLVIGEE